MNLHQENLKRIESLARTEMPLSPEIADEFKSLLENIKNSQQQAIDSFFKIASSGFANEIHRLDEFAKIELPKAYGLNCLHELPGERTALLISVMIVAGLMNQQDTRNLLEFIEESSSSSE